MRESQHEKFVSCRRVMSCCGKINLGYGITEQESSPQREKCFFLLLRRATGCASSRFNNRNTEEVSSLTTTFVKDEFVVARERWDSVTFLCAQLGSALARSPPSSRDKRQMRWRLMPGWF